MFQIKRFSGYAFFVLIGFSPLLKFLAFATSTDLANSPIHIHLTWQNDTNTTITMSWQTNAFTSGDTVLYDSVSRGGLPGNYRYIATGINYTYSGASGWINNVELTGLTPDTVYYFICGGDAGGWSNERAFRTAPSVSSDVRFVAGGDSRTNPDDRTKVSKAMNKFNPDFVMHVGDMVENGSIQSQWDSWFTDVNDNWVGTNGLAIPIIPVLGNHERPNNPDCKYFSQFALPGNERWYSFDWGPDIHIICLDTEASASGAQRDWLENDLASHANYRWKFVQFHRPPFVSGGHFPWTDALTHWVPLFDKYHVDIVFSGHEHNFQRTYPLNWTASQTERQDYSNGTMYVVSGGWGAPLCAPTPIWYMAHQKRTHHFCLVDVFANGTLRLQAKDNLGNTFDEVTIRKTPVHDIALVEVTLSSTDVIIGELVSINVTVSNKGTEMETFNVSVYYNEIEIDTQTITELTAPAEKTLTFTWNTTGLSVGNYIIKAVAETVTEETNTANNAITFEDIHVITEFPLDENLQTEPPTVLILSPENKTYAISSIPLSFTVNESSSWIGYSQDGQANVTIIENATLTGLLDGSHYVVVYANDSAGNMGASSKVYFTVDTTPPSITDVSQSLPANNVLPEDEVKINATVVDELGGVKRVTLNYTNGNGTWVTVDMTNLGGNVWNATMPAFPYGTNVTYRIIAEDNMNNTITTEDLGYEYQYIVIPELPTRTSMLLVLVVLTVAIVIYKRRLFKIPSQ